MVVPAFKSKLKTFVPHVIHSPSCDLTAPAIRLMAGLMACLNVFNNKKNAPYLANGQGRLLNYNYGTR